MKMKPKIVKLMITLIVFIVFIILLISFSDNISNKNLIENPSFEIFHDSEIPENWKFVASDGNTPSLDNVFHNGSHSIKISIIGKTDGKSGYPQSNLIKAEPLQYYTFSAWGKTKNIGGSDLPAVRIVELDANMNWLHETNLEFGGSKNWTQERKKFQTRSNTAYFYVYANILNGYGTFWVDDVDLKKTLKSSYYVSPDGNDNNSGSEQSPWRTIQKAANILHAGDTVYIMQGTYNEKVKIQNSGSPGNYITFTQYPGHIVTIDGTGISLPNWYGLINILGKNYIKISGLRVINSEFAGIFVAKDYDLGTRSSNIIIENNYIENTSSSGIMALGEASKPSTNYIIDGNEVVRAQSNGHTVNECITLAYNVDIFEVKNNIVRDCLAEGIDVKAGVSNGRIYRNRVYNTSSIGIYIDAWDKYAYNIDIFENIVHDQTLPWGGGFNVASEQGGTVENITFYNNIVYNNTASGIAIGWYSKGPVRNITIISNTFYRNGYGTDWGGGIDIVYTRAQNVVVRNNIVSQNNNFQIHYPNPRPDIIVDYNLINGYRGYGNEVYGTYFVKGDPEFVNAAESDFHLKSTSPAIDEGSSVGAPNVDFDWNHRPQGTEYDIGVFEFVK